MWWAVAPRGTLVLDTVGARLSGDPRARPSIRSERRVVHDLRVGDPQRAYARNMFPRNARLFALVALSSPVPRAPTSYRTKSACRGSRGRCVQARSKRALTKAKCSRNDYRNGPPTKSEESCLLRREAEGRRTRSVTDGRRRCRRTRLEAGDSKTTSGRASDDEHTRRMRERGQGTGDGSRVHRPRTRHVDSAARRRSDSRPRARAARRPRDRCSCSYRAHSGSPEIVDALRSISTPDAIDCGPCRAAPRARSRSRPRPLDV